MTRPTSLDELRDVVAGGTHLRPRGAGTKPALSAPRGEETVLDLSGLSGMVEHTPEECTFTALAGTPVADIERLLAGHRQYLPFDPPLAATGATIGGTVASGLNGSGRYRYGGIRDFLIGARIVDGKGRLVTSGGKVVKNAAGLLLHYAMIGSSGRLGVLVELTFKVFPRAESYATVRARTSTLDGALAAMARARGGPFDLDAVDIAQDSTLWLRLSGPDAAMASRVDGLRRALGVPSDVLRDAEDAQAWSEFREFAWAPAAAALVRVPVTTARVGEVEAICEGVGATRRYAVGGNVAFIAWPAPVADLSRRLESSGLTGQVLRGATEGPYIGARQDEEFVRRVAAVMDPDNRFAGGA